MGRGFATIVSGHGRRQDQIEDMTNMTGWSWAF